MECLVAIGTVIFEKSIGPVRRQVDYVIHYDENLEKLERQVRALEAARESMQHAIKTEEGKGRKIETGVRNWQMEVDEKTSKAKKFLSDVQRAESRCLLCFGRHHLSRKSTKLVEEIVEIIRKNDFSIIAYDVKLPEVCSLSKDCQAFDSRTLVATNIMNELIQSDLIGVYGIGGVGKTTLAKEVYRQAINDASLFDDVVLVLDVTHVNNIPDLEEIQKKVAEKLGMEILGDESADNRAKRICGRIEEKKVLLILDNIQKKVDLEKVGFPLGRPGCKVLLTSRTRDVLSVEMHTQKEFQLDLLEEAENWSLFEKMAGDVVKNPTIRKVAEQVARKCGGLPVMVVTVARALKNTSDLPAWKGALQDLKAFDKRTWPENAYSALKWSYEQLDDEKAKSLLLLLSGIMRHGSMNLLDLLNYSKGLGLIGTVATMEEARNTLRLMVDKLKDSCLLLEDVDNKNYVKMHDLVHEVLNRLASNNQHVFRVDNGDEFKKWPTKEVCIESTMILLRSCTIPRLPGGLEYPELKLFTFSGIIINQYLEIPSNFFEGMKKLRVLDFTFLDIPSLPPSLQFLSSLQTLCLDICTLGDGDLAIVGELRSLEVLSFLKSKFTELPKEIGQLTRLRSLDLNGCSQLKVIAPHVLSNLTNLENLRMGNSFNQWEGEGVISSERRNANIEELKHLSGLKALQVHIPDAKILPADLFTTTELERFQICIGSAWNWDNLDEDLNALKLQLTASNELDQGLRKLLKETHDLYLEGSEDVNNSIVYQLGDEGFQKLKHLHVHREADFKYIINGKVGYHNLTWLAVNKLNGLRFFLSSSMARSFSQLKRLQISECQIMEEIISIEESNQEIAENFFPQLQDLELIGLPILSKFSSSRKYTALSNPSSGRLQFMNCMTTNTICEEIEETGSTRNLDIVQKHFLFDNKVEFTNLKKLSIDGLAKLTTVWTNQLFVETSINVETIEVVSCVNLKSIFPASLAKSFQKLRRLKVKNCGMEEIVSKEADVQTTPKFVFSELRNVEFKNLPQLQSFYPGCANNIEDANSNENIDAGVVKRSLFNNKVEFPELTDLSLKGLTKLTTIWHSQLSPDSFNRLRSLKVQGCENLLSIFVPNTMGRLNYLAALVILECRSLKEVFQLNGIEAKQIHNTSALPQPNFFVCEKLDYVVIGSCKSLKNIFPLSVARNLQQLKALVVKNCDGVKEIVAREEGLQRTIHFVFPKVTQVLFVKLSQLINFYPGMYTCSWPSLRVLQVTECNKAIFAGGISNFREKLKAKSSSTFIDRQCLFSIDEDSFPNLENLKVNAMEFSNGPLPAAAQLFGKLNFFEVRCPESKSLIFFDKLLDTEGNGTSTVGVRTQQLLHLKILGLCEMNKLENLGLDDEDEVDIPNIPNLETLAVTGCRSLRNLRSSAISFNNLTTLQIFYCEELQYLITYSMARSLMQLTTLSVEQCFRLVQIVGSNDDADLINEITFPRLKHLKLSVLPRLQRFCFQNSIARFPSLETSTMSNRLKWKIFAADNQMLQLTTNEGEEPNADQFEDELDAFMPL